MLAPRPILCLILVAAAGCGGDGVPDATDTWVPPGCGDGELDADEQCDDGADNSDTAPDACRTTCLSPWCGDGVTDQDEACDDANGIGGDGCTPACAVEDGQLETEPNDSADEAEDWSGDTVYGSLGEGDRDCVGLALAACEALDARIVAPCDDPAMLSLFDPDGALLAVSALDSDGCAHLDPTEAPGARFVDAGDWAVCVEGALGREVSAYALEIAPVAAEDASYPLSDADDPDGDGLPANCDDDRDGDGVLDEEDNCPDVSNGPDTAALSTSDDGFIRTWLTVGPFTGESSASSCLPTATPLVHETDDGQARPALGDTAGEAAWRVLWSDSDRVDFTTDYATVDAPREVYAAVYLWSDEARDLTLALGPDDGATAWIDEAVVLEIDGCQGTTADQFTAAVTLPAGWSRLLLKVYDQGGGWGTYARFLDDSGAAVTDLELSLSPDGAWENDQTDTDGDGTGDVCDDSPAG